MKVADPGLWRRTRGKQEAIRTGLVTPGGTTDSSVLPARRNATEFAYECTRFYDLVKRDKSRPPRPIRKRAPGTLSSKFQTPFSGPAAGVAQECQSEGKTGT